MNREVTLYLDKADHALQVASVLIEAGHNADASSKVYYAMFYATQALLKSQGIDVIKHSAVESALGYHFVRTGKIPQNYHKSLINARRIREIADYDLDEECFKPSGKTMYEEGVEFVRVIRTLIQL